MDEPPGEPWVPAVVCKMGMALVTDMVAVSLSKVTTRGVDMTWASADEFINDNTADAPSAFRKPVLPKNPLFAVLPTTPGRSPRTLPPTADFPVIPGTPGETVVGVCIKLLP